MGLITFEGICIEEVKLRNTGFWELESALLGVTQSLEIEMKKSEHFKSNRTSYL